MSNIGYTQSPEEKSREGWRFAKQIRPDLDWISEKHNGIRARCKTPPQKRRGKGACCRKQLLRHAHFANKSREKQWHSVKKQPAKAKRGIRNQGLSKNRPACVWLFNFCENYETILRDTRVFSRLCSRFIHSFLRSNARARKNSSVRILPLPLVRKRRNPKSFFSSANAPST